MAREPFVFAKLAIGSEFRFNLVPVRKIGRRLKDNDPAGPASSHPAAGVGDLDPVFDEKAEHGLGVSDWKIARVHACLDRHHGTVGFML